MIAAHPVFNNNGTRGKKQNPVVYQVMTLLFYLGSSGSGASQSRARDRFHIGKGSRDTYVWRCIRAIRDVLRPLYYKWPDAHEREGIAGEIKEEFQLPNCLGFADGTLLPSTWHTQRPCTLASCK